MTGFKGTMAATGQIKPPSIMHVLLSMVVGGAEKLVYDLVRHPAFAECRPVICCLDAVGDLGEKLRQQGYMIHLKERRSGLDLSVVPWLVDIIRREKVDIVHAHQYTPLFYSVPAALLAGRLRVVYTEHGRLHPDSSSWKRQLFNPLLALGVDHLVSISSSTAKAMAKYDHLPLRRIKVIHNGVDFSRLNPAVDLPVKRRELGLSPGCRIIGTAARLNEIKNIPMMLRVFQLVLKSVPDTCLLIAGQGERLDALKAYAHELGIGERVKFLGLRFDMPEIYQLFEVFLLTSFTEGISVTLLEAMGSGVPCVVTDVGGNGEVLTGGRTGYLTPLGSDAVMAERVVELLSDAGRSAEISENARRSVSGRFSFDAMLERYRNECYLHSRDHNSPPPFGAAAT